MADRHILKNGMVILGERMERVDSVAFGFMIPAGASRMEEGCCGASNIISDWIFRGAGDKNSRELSDALDGLGLHRSSSIGSAYLITGSALEASNFSKALDLYADIILRPQLADDNFPAAKQLAMDGVTSLDDDPRQNVMLKLREKFYPSPLGNSTAGDIDDLKNLTAGRVREIKKKNFNLSGTMFAIAGKYDFDSVVEQLERLFASKESIIQTPVEVAPETDDYLHIPNEGAQVHIGLMTQTVTPADEDYYNARVAVSVLSGGMSGRLFTEVREKRGLCYAVGARYHSLKDAAGIMCYAGTTSGKQQETFDVIIQQFRKLKDGITEKELHRAKVGLKSALVMQSESSGRRADAIGNDYHLLGRVRSVEEILEKTDRASVDSVMSFLKKNRFEKFTVVTIGPESIKMNR